MSEHKYEWLSWADGKWAIDTMKLDTAEHNIAGTVIEMPDGDWHCTVSFTIEADNFAEAKEIAESMVDKILGQE